MRKNSIARNVITNELGQAELAVIFKSQKTHDEGTVGQLWVKESLKKMQVRCVRIVQSKNYDCTG